MKTGWSKPMAYRMKSLLVLAFLALLIYPKVHGDLLKSYKVSSLPRISAEEEEFESKHASHSFRLRLSQDSANLVHYSCGDRYQIQLVSLNKVDTFRGFLVHAYSGITRNHTPMGAFFQPVSTTDWKAATCYNRNDCATNATDLPQHSVLLTWIAPCESTADISFWYTVIDSTGQLHGPMHSLTLVHITSNQNQDLVVSRIRRAIGATLEEGLEYLPFFEIEGIPVNITSQDACSNAIAISTGLHFGGNRFTELYICENGIISVGSASLDVSSSDNISPFPINGSEARLIAPLWSDVDVVGTVNGEILYQIFTEDSDRDQLESVSQFISHQYQNSSGVTFTGKWMIVVEWNRVLPHSQPPGSDARTNTYQAAIITDGGLAFAVFTYECGSLQWFDALLFSAFQSVVGINDGRGCCRSVLLNSTSDPNAFTCVSNGSGFANGWSNRIYLLTTQNPAPPIVLAETNRENTLSRDNVTLQFAISAYPRVKESLIRLQFQQDNSGTITEVTCGERLQLSGRSPIGEVSCTRNNSLVFVTLSEVTLQAAGRYTLTAGNEVGNGANFINLVVRSFDSSRCSQRQEICDIARVNDPDDLSALLADITEDAAELDAGEISVVSELLFDLATEAVNNTQLRARYLRTIDNLLRADPDILMESQGQHQSSARVLYSLEDFVGQLQLSNSETFTETGFAFQLHDIPDPNQFRGQDFSVNLGNAEEARNTNHTMDIDPMTLVPDLDETATAYVSVPGTVFRGQSQSRLAFFVFLRDNFFQNVGGNVTVGSIVLGVSASTEAAAGGDTPLRMGFRFIKNNATDPVCSIFDAAANGGLGVWSNENCRMIPCGGDADDDQVCCECNQTSRQRLSRRQSPSLTAHPIGHFGLLLSPSTPNLPPQFQLTLAIFSNIGAAISLLCLILLVVTYMASKKLRTTTHGRLLINLSVSLMGLYIFFIVGGPVGGINVVCEINSALLQYFMLVYFGWTAAEAINLYVKLVKVMETIHFVSSHYVLKAGLIVWLVPVIILVPSAGAGYMFYFSNFFCRPFEWPFWFGLILPVGIIFIFDWIMFFVIMRALYKHTKESLRLGKGEKQTSDDVKKIAQYSVVLATLFGLGWTFGLLATNFGDQNLLSFIFSFFFCLFVGCQGILILYFHGVRSPDAVAVWKRWYLKCCPCGKGETKNIFSSKTPRSTSTKSAILSKSEIVESLPTVPENMTTSHRSPSLPTSIPGRALGSLLTSPRTPDSESEVNSIALLPVSKETSGPMDRDGEKTDMVDYV